MEKWKENRGYIIVTSLVILIPMFRGCRIRWLPISGREMCRMAGAVKALL